MAAAIIEEDGVFAVPPAATTGSRFTIAGPPPCTAVEGGDILEDPELLWMEDEEWDEARIEAAKVRILAQGKPLTQHWINEYVQKASKHWSNFYKRNGDRGYKDRHYLHVEFPELVDPRPDGLTLLEVGCGVGNAVLPLLELNPCLRVHAIDFATSAIDILKEHPFAVDAATSYRLQCSVCDVVKDQLPVSDNSQDLVLCMFVLSAVPPSAHAGVLEKLSRCLKVGGKLLFRDYGRFDEAQLRFKKNSLLGENFYVRCDGTCSYFWELEELTAVCSRAGLTPVEDRCKYVRRQMSNRAQKKARYRVWIQATYVKLEGAVGEKLGEGILGN